MTFPTGTTISTLNVDSPDDDPSLARVDIYQLILTVNAIVASANSAQGVALLDGLGRIPGSRLPGTFSPSGIMQFQPGAGVVNINNVLRLAQLYTVDLGLVNGTQDPTVGDLIFLQDGDAGEPCLSCYDGSKWRIVRLMTEVGDVGGVLTAVSTLTAEAD